MGVRICELIFDVVRDELVYDSEWRVVEVCLLPVEESTRMFNPETPTFHLDKRNVY